MKKYNEIETTDRHVAVFNDSEYHIVYNGYDKRNGGTKSYVHMFTNFLTFPPSSLSLLNRWRKKEKCLDSFKNIQQRFPCPCIVHAQKLL